MRGAMTYPYQSLETDTLEERKVFFSRPMLKCQALIMKELF